MPHLGTLEIVCILVVVILLFGVNKIPQLGKGIGEGIRNFKSSLKAGEEEEPKKDDKA
jgi:sec-independent protein translocase protein TatA